MTQTPALSPAKRRLTPARIALLYAAFAIVWVVTSDALLRFYVADPVLQQRIELGKGLLFVLVTSGLLYLVLQQWQEPLAPVTAEPVRDRSRSMSRYVRWFGLLIMLLLVPLAGYVVVKVHGPQIEREALANLESIAELKASQTEYWLEERYNDGRVIMASASFVEQVARMSKMGTEQARQEARLGLAALVDSYQYESASLVDSSGQLLISLGDHPVSSAQTVALLPKAVASGQPVFGEIVVDSQEVSHLDLIVPLFSISGVQRNAVAFVVLHVTPDVFLLPYLPRWPTRSESGEVLLLRHDGDSVLYINAVRGRSEGGQNLRTPLSRRDCAALAVESARKGTCQGTDYRDNDVFTAFRPVAGMSWVIVAKLDRAEVLRPLTGLAFWVSLIAFVAISSVGAVMLMLWRQTRRTFALEMQAQSDSLLRQFYDLPFIGLAKSSPTTRQWLQCNDRMCEILGYPRKELFQLSWTDITHPDDLAADVAQLEAMLRGENNGYSMEKRFIRKNGEVVFTALDVRCIRRFDETPDYAIVTLQDITERKQAEARIQRLTRIYAALSECNQAIVHCNSSDELFPVICRVAVELGGLKTAWIGLIDPDTHQVKPVASFGDDEGRLQDVFVSADATTELGRGATGTAIRERRPVWVQDYLQDSMTAPWHKHAERAGWRSVGALPLNRNDEVIGALTLLAGDIFAFDEAARNLLIEMATDISYALTSFARETERKQMELALRDSESRFRNLYEKAPLAYQSLDIEGNILEVNEAWLTLLGRRREDVIGHFVGEYLTDVSVITLQNEFPKFQQNGYVNGPLFQFRRSDGSLRLVMINGQISRDRDGHFLRTHCILTDLTERMKAEEQLRLSAQVFEQSAEGVVITDPERRILMTNLAFTKITGYAHEEVVGQTPRVYSSGRHDQGFYRDLWMTVKAEGYWRGEIWNRRKDGAVYPALTSISQVLDEQGKISHYISVFSDISEHKASQEHIQRLAHYDSLTGLPNRSLLADRVGQALGRMVRYDETLAMIFLDLDRFKNVNDSLGHRVGDDLLIQVAERLKACLRDEDTVSRLGGDEFIVVLPGASADGAAHVAEKILAELSHPYHIEPHELTITPSMGIAMYPADGSDYDTLSMCADAAMYRAKQAGRSTFRFFTREMQERSDRVLQLENALRRVLELDQLHLCYQPQMSMDGERVIGVEALLRWQHPELGNVSPADFVPVAEDSGLILPIGEWVLETAVRQMKRWVDAGLSPVVLAVNLSAVQFRQANLPEMVSRILERHGLPPHFLELELTEGVAMDNPLAAIEIMNALHCRGIRMSIDDFGTGYSSLSYLKRFKVYKLKIDQSFVRDISHDPDDEAIVKAIIGLSRSLGLKTIAEGVETGEQLEFLREKGCDEAQGFLFGKPMTASDFETFVRCRPAID